MKNSLTKYKEACIQTFGIEYTQCLFRWIKDNDYMPKLRKNRNNLNYPGASYFEPLLYVCDAMNKDITSWSTFMKQYFKLSDLEKYFKNNSVYPLFRNEYILKHRNFVGH